MQNHLVRIGWLPMSLLLILALSLVDHITIFSTLLEFGKRDTWLGILIAAAAIPLWLALLRYIMKETGNENLYAWLKRNYGSFAAAAFAVPAGLYLALNLVHVLRIATNWTMSAYLPSTPPAVVALICLTFAFIAARYGLHAIVISAGILLPASLSLSAFMAVANIPNLDFSYLTPVLEHGWIPALKAGGFAFAGFSEMAIVLIMQHYLRAVPRLSSLIGVFALLAGMMVVPALYAVAAFGPAEASAQLYPFYEQWRLVRIDKFIDHIDFLSVFQWISTSFIRISLALFLLGELLAAFGGRKRTGTLLLIGAAAFAVSLVPASAGAFHRFLLFYFAATVAISGLLSVSLAVLVRLKSRKRRESHAG